MFPALALCAVLAAARAPGRAILPDVRSNPNVSRAGVLHQGVLTVALEAKPSLWLFSKNRPPMTVAAFSEADRSPLMPGPLIRVPAGTQLHLSVRNSLSMPLTFVMPASMHGGPDRIDAADSIVIEPGAAGTLTIGADIPGNYVYRGKLPDGVTKVSNIAGMLAGAIVVDSANPLLSPGDRVFVILATEDSASAACDDTVEGNPLATCHARRFIYTLNGTQWPNTERIRATVGDALHWRVINASYQVHPMHLHGFYYRVDDLSGPLAGIQSRPASGQWVVTQLLAPLSAMSMTWSPDRPGNWLFHCHFALHNTSYSLLAQPEDREMRDMVGLVLGATVAARPGASTAVNRAPARRLRLVAEPANPTMGMARDSVQGMHFVLEEHGLRIDTHADVSPELDLVRGQPVSITIVNQLAEPTSVHWHGIEVEDSYMDGAPGFSGAGSHLTPEIAPGDSFVARFTPPRSGTFIYHAHVNEMREELAGLEGVLIVRDAGGAPSPDDHAFLLKGDPASGSHPLEINGQRDPDTLVLHVGRTARFRLLNLETNVTAATPSFWLTARPDSLDAVAGDTMVVQWRPVAKDAFDLPRSARSLVPARQVVSVGETFDFEYTPARRGTLRLEVRAPTGQHRLYIRVPIRVE